MSQHTDLGGKSLPVASVLTEAIFPLVQKLLEIDKALDSFRALVALESASAARRLAAVTLLTREQAAALLSMSESQLDREHNAGALPMVKIDRRPRYSLVDLEIFINSRRVEGSRRKSRKPEPANFAPPRRRGRRQQP